MSLEIEASFELDEFPSELSFPVEFMGWDANEDRLAEVHALEIHPPADVTITLKRKWANDSGKCLALYEVTACHGA